MQKNTAFSRLFAFKSNSKASIGIGAMIVFIATVLVAGIAASVLIQTSNQLETQAMRAGQDTCDEVSSGIGVVKIVGQYGNRNVSGTYYNRFHNMSIMITSRSGGSGVNLDQVVVKMSNGSKLCLLSWDTSFALAPSASGLFSTANMFDIGADDFGIIVIEDADGSCTASNPVINKGDKVVLTVNLSACFGGLASREDLEGMVIPEMGSPGVFLFRTPGTNNKTLVDLM
jgi:archaeal flagellin FlaB